MTNEEIFGEAKRIYPEDAQSLLAFFRGAEWHRDRSNHQNAADPPIGGAVKVGDDSSESAPSRAGR